MTEAINGMPNFMGTVDKRLVDGRDVFKEKGKKEVRNVIDDGLDGIEEGDELLWLEANLEQN